MNTTTTPPRHPTWRDEIEDAATRVGAPPIYGPPVAFLFGPWLLLGLLLSVPFGGVFALLLVLAAAVALLALVGAVLASPYLLVRYLRAHGALRMRPLVHLRRFRAHRVSSARIGSPQPKGMS